MIALFEPWTIEEFVQLARIKPPMYAIDEVQARMMELAIEFHIDCQDRPPPRAVFQPLKHALKHARHLAAELNSDHGAVQRYLALHIPQGQERLDGALASLRELAAWIDRVVRAERQKSAPGTRADKAAQALVDGLGRVWKEHWGKNPGASMTKLKSGDKVFDSPFIRFVRTYLSALRFEFDTNVLNADPRIKAALEMTPQQIRERIRAPRRKKLRMGK